jgi:hypothetical protein
MARVLATRLALPRHRFLLSLLSLSAAGVLGAGSTPAAAAVFASSVQSYTAGTGISAAYQNPQAALGKPNPFTGDVPFRDVLTPFNAAYSGTDLVGIGPGGSLTLQFPQPIPVGAGPEFGVHAGVNLVDTDYPNGRSASPASTFNNRAASVSVSANGMDFVDLGPVTFNIPTNYYDQGITTPGSQETAGTHEADFGKPFTGSLADFSGKDWPGTLALLNGSAGGKWLDVQPAQLTQIQFVRFSVGAGQTMYVDAVAAAPEPTSLGAITLAGGGLLLRRRRTPRKGWAGAR